MHSYSSVSPTAGFYQPPVPTPHHLFFSLSSRTKAKLPASRSLLTRELLFNSKRVAGWLLRPIKAAGSESCPPYKSTLFLTQLRGRFIEQKPSWFYYSRQGKTEVRCDLTLLASYFSSSHLILARPFCFKSFKRKSKKSFPCFACKRATVSWPCLYPTPLTVKLPRSAALPPDHKEFIYPEEKHYSFSGKSLETYRMGMGTRRAKHLLSCSSHSIDGVGLTDTKM